MITLTQEQWDRIVATIPSLRGTKTFKDGLLTDFIPTLTKSTDVNLKLKYWKHFPVWKEKAYVLGENVIDGDYPFTCVQAHTSVGNPSWSPRNAPALFAPYHAISAEHALPWIAPTGAQDIYKKK